MYLFGDITLDNKYAFRHPMTALENGLVDITGELTPEYILMAYRWGIFPWVNEVGYFLWFFLDPRLVLFPENLHVSKSMRPYFNQEKYRVSFDKEFNRVIRSCKNVYRKGEIGSWIDEDFISAYSDLHKKGYAHSVEVWEGEELVGGLYGIAIGKIFYGESMFNFRPNASKFGFIELVRYLKSSGFVLIDCQQDTPHLRSMGAEIITGQAFLDALRENMFRGDNAGLWA